MEVNENLQETIVKIPESTLDTSVNDSGLVANQPASENIGPKALVNHVNEWEKQYIREGHSIISTKTYLSFIRRFVHYGVVIDQQSINRFRVKNMSHVCAGALKSFFLFLVEKFEFPEDILSLRMGKSKTKKRKTESVSMEEVNKIIEAMKDDSEIGMKDKMLTLTLYSLGLRLSEGLKLRWQDINWSEFLKDRAQQGTVQIINTKRGKSRTLPISPKLLNLLYDNHMSRKEDGSPIDGLIFDYGMSKYNSNKKDKIELDQYNYLNFAKHRYRKILEEVSFKVLGKKVNPHRLRHVKATDMMEHDIPIETIKNFLGHSSIVSTQVYVSMSTAKLKRELEKYDKEKVGV